MSIFYQVIQFLLSISLLVLIHELGHFMFARLFKIKVEKFYLFFNPWFSLFKHTAKKSGTEYGLGWLPLGGYCSIAGMIDETKGADQLSSEPQEWEFRVKPAWQRLLVIIGGVLFNTIGAFIIYSAMLGFWGKEYIPVSSATYGYQFCEAAKGIGFQNGDKIFEVDGKKVKTLNEISSLILLEKAAYAKVQRGDSSVVIYIPENFTQRLLASGSSVMMTERFPFVIHKVQSGMAAQKAGLQEGDSLMSINQVPIGIFQDFAEHGKKFAGQTVQLTYKRSGTVLSTPLSIDSNGKLGVYTNPFDYIKTAKETYSFFAAIPAGIKMGYNTLTNYVKQFKIIFTKEGAKNLGGFGTMASLYEKTWDWQSFWGTTALLSIILAVMNILPIPALDGGHLLFIVYEMISGKKPNEKFLEYAQLVGFSLLILLVIYANGNDILRFFLK